ncbi:TPA: molybdate metabolism regulator, partial [Escherichia coli]
ECRPQSVAEEYKYATADMLPQLFVAPPWVINKKKNVIPVFDLPVLPVPAVTDITPGITELISHTDISRFSEIAQYQASQQTLFTDLPLIEKESWETSFIPFTPEQQILWQLGFNEWRHCEDDLHEKKYIPQSAVDALLRFDFPTLKAEFAKYHNNANKSWNLSALCYLPGQQAISFLNQIIIEEQYSGEKEILGIFGSTAIPSFMTCLQRDHQRLWIFTLFIGASELALPMAQRLQKKMAYK